MILSSNEFKNVCSVVLSATDGSELSAITETLELKTSGNILYMCVTNKEYFAQVKFQLDHEEDFHASVNANLFLKLIAAITTEQIELTVHDTYLNIKANGNYKLPLIFENDQLMQVPEIKIENPTVEMDIQSSILESIVNFNSKQLLVGSTAKPVQKMFYVDNEGCITFTSGACVNSFSLSQPVRVLLNTRLVNLFKLFKNSDVHFVLGYDPISETIVKTKVSFETPTIKLTAVTGCNDDLLSQVPVNAIRGRANKAYDNSVVVSVADMSEAIGRLLLFSAGFGTKENLKPYSMFAFSRDSVTIYDSKRENIEIVKYQNNCTLDSEYTMTLDLVELKKILDNSNEQYVTLNFGDHKACVVVKNNIKNVIPEVTTKHTEQ